MKNESCKTPRPFFLNSAARLAALAILTLGVASGCAAPASVEGVLSEIEFAFEDPRPAVRIDGRGDQIHLIISEETSTTLTVAQVRLPTTDVVAGETFSFGDDENSTESAHLHMSRGDVEVTRMSNGTRVVSSRNNTVADSVSGTITIDEVDGVLAGSFTATLEDGGDIDGRFVIEVQ